MKTELIGIALVVVCLGVYVESRKCYKCHEPTDPEDTDCWNNTVGGNGVEEVECEQSCYSETFRSAGDYWYVTKGCAVDGCSSKMECHGPNWGFCIQCCKGELCNTDSPAGAVSIIASTVILLSAFLMTRI